MLALTRRVGEEIVIGDPQQPLGIIRVVEIHGDKVRLSFDFPREVAINRRELADEKVRRAAAEAARIAAQSASAEKTPAPNGNPTRPQGNGAKQAEAA